MAPSRRLNPLKRGTHHQNLRRGDPEISGRGGAPFLFA
jgi:hypothetical protein